MDVEIKDVKSVVDDCVFGERRNKWPNSPLPTQNEAKTWYRELRKCDNFDLLEEAIGSVHINSKWYTDVMPYLVIDKYKGAGGKFRKIHGETSKDVAKEAERVWRLEDAQLKRVLAIIESLHPEEKQSLHVETVARMRKIDDKTGRSLKSHIPGVHKSRSSRASDPFIENLRMRIEHHKIARKDGWQDIIQSIKKQIQETEDKNRSDPMFGNSEDVVQEVIGNDIYKRELCWTWAEKDRDPDFLNVFPRSFWAMVFGDQND